VGPDLDPADRHPDHRRAFRRRLDRSGRCRRDGLDRGNDRRTGGGPGRLTDERDDGGRLAVRNDPASGGRRMRIVFGERGA
jgi:hypothetical protein